jgi:hypothetical protein
MEQDKQQDLKPVPSVEVLAQLLRVEEVQVAQSDMVLV